MCDVPSFNSDDSLDCHRFIDGNVHGSRADGYGQANQHTTAPSYGHAYTR